VWQSIIAFLEAPTNVGAFLLVGSLGAIVSVWGVTTQRAIARRRATLDHIAHSERDGDVIAARKKFIAAAKNPGGLALWADEDKEQTEEAQAIKSVLNEFELIAIGIQRGIIDYELYRRWNKSSVVRYWSNSAPFIFSLRSRLKNDAIYHEFEEMARWMKGEAMPRRNRWIGSWF
jgi:Domain of unknown function (DUF4760)